MSLAVLKRKTKETNKTKQGTFSLNGTKRNLSYVGKNYAGMTRNPYCYANSKNIKKSVGSQKAYNCSRVQQAKDIDVEEELAETIHLWVTPNGADEDDPTNIECLTPITKVNVVNSSGNKYVFNNSDTYDSDISYGLYNGTYIFTGISIDHPMAIIIPEEKKHLISYTGVSYYDNDGVEQNADQGSEGSDFETYYYGSIRVEVMGDFGTVSVKCLYHGYMGGNNLLTYTDSCVSENHYKFYTDANGLNELTPKFTLYLNNTYIFHRLPDDSKDQHPFYISDSGYGQNSNKIILSGDGNPTQGIVNNETFTLNFNNLTVNLCKKFKASTIVRGLRAVSDFEYEFQLAGMNKKLDTKIETIFLMSDVENQIISSKFVKEIAYLGGSVDRFVTKYVVKMLKDKY